MKSRDFVYWLQGVFEIGELDVLNEKQIEIVQAHLKMVFEYEKSPEISFVHWINGFLNGKTSLDKEEVKVLRKEINGVFEHVIDPTFGTKAKDVLEKMHRQGRTSAPFDPNTTKIMC